MVFRGAVAWEDYISGTTEEPFLNPMLQNFYSVVFTQNIIGNWANRVKEWEECSMQLKVSLQFVNGHTRLRQKVQS